ncbi:MAG: response regulator [Chloroflexi bacterium]|nr:response regulator [Chloroflexota bacterium]
MIFKGRSHLISLRQSLWDSQRMSVALLPRMILGFFVLACIGGAIGYVGFSSSRTLVRELDAIADNSASEFVAMGKVRALSLQLHDQAISIAFFSDENSAKDVDGLVQEELIALSITDEKLDQAINELRLLVEENAGGLADESDEIVLVRNLEARKKELLASADSLITVKQKGNSSPEAVNLARLLGSAEQRLLATIDGGLNAEIAELEQRRKTADILSSRSTKFIIVVSVVGVLIMLALGFIITKYVWGLMRKLNLASSDAKDASRAKTEFLAGMSHEIRTPMNAIIGMADLLSETPLNTEQREYLKVFKTAGENLLEIINDILDVSKVEAGDFTLEAVNFDLGELVENTAQVMAIGAHEKRLELNCQVSPDLPRMVVGDPVRVRQIITNLLGNAIKFTASGEVSIHVEPEPDSENPGAVSFCVSDSGIGIPEDKLEAIFDTFTQADTSTTRQYGGTGLGLTICRHLVDFMGGRIWVESETGKGSTFYFTLRLGTVAQGMDRPDVTFEDLNGLKILIIDDNPTNRLILIETLTAWNGHPTAVEDGNLGLSELKRAEKSGEPYQLLLLDRRMPGIDGFGVAERIKEEMPISNVTIMMLTSDNRSEDIGRCQELGLARYLVKPVGRIQLFQAISEVLAASPVNVPEDTTVPKIGLPSDQQSLRILLVEDSSDNRQLMLAYLKKTSYQVDIAENGQIAVEKFTADPYDLVLMDMQMPVMDGYTATRRIREWEQNQSADPALIIALTAYALKDDEQKSLDVGCDLHLTKPIKKAQLLETISEQTQQMAEAAD